MKTTAMSECFHNDDVMTLICNELEPRDACALACTAKHLFEPATARIWRNLTSWKALLSCLPDDLIEYKNLNGINEAYLVPGKTITSVHLERYLAHYAPKIRRLDPYVWSSCNLSESLLLALDSAVGFKDGALAPNLRIFASPWRPSPYLSLAPLPAFLPPTLECLSFPAILDPSLGGTERVLQALKALGELGNVSSLQIDERPSWLKTVDIQLYLPGPSWKSLRKFSIVPRLTPEQIDTLGELPNLEELRMGETTSTTYLTDISDTAVYRSGTFARLSSLKVSMETMGQVVALLQKLPSCGNLREVACESELYASQAELRSLTDTLLSRLSRNRPSVLRVADGVSEHMNFLPRRGQPAVVDMPYHPPFDITPLFNLGSLVRLKFQVRGGIDLTPSIVAGISQSSPWPNMLELDFRPTGELGVSPGIDHSHLLVMFRAFPSLQCAGVSFDAGRIVPLNPGVPPAQTFPLCQTLAIWQSPIMSPTNVREWVRAYFPAIRAYLLEYGMPANRLEL